jgi:putative protein-disulfide isomerase
VTVELLYFANPMCSWCWGFAPVVRGLVERHGPAVRLTLALGALGRGDRPMRAEDKAFVREHWEHVRERTGQPFDFAFFDRAEGFVYDTEPACRAVAVVRGQQPELALPYFHAVQEAFYAHDRDVTKLEELCPIAVALGLDEAGFAQAFAEARTRAAVAREFAETAALGVAGYPTLLRLEDGRADVLSLGYRPLAEVEAALGELAATG